MQIVFVWFAAVFALGSSAAADTPLRDIDGMDHGNLERLIGSKWSVLFFLMSDCPIANRYAPEIQRICAEYGAKGAQCFLVYPDAAENAAAVRKHVHDFGYKIPAIRDTDHALMRKAGATVSSEVAVFSDSGELKYRGRIDNFHADLGVSRQKATEHDLRDVLAALTTGRNISNPRTQPIGCFLPQ
jgi:hypothetical protein